MAQSCQRDQQNKCLKVIAAADKALAEKNKALELGDLALKNCRDATSQTIKENDKLRESNGAWFRNPFVIGILGIATGITLSQTLFKK